MPRPTDPSWAAFVKTISLWQEAHRVLLRSNQRLWWKWALVALIARGVLCAWLLCLACFSKKKNPQQTVACWGLLLVGKRGLLNNEFLHLAFFVFHEIYAGRKVFYVYALGVTRYADALTLCVVNRYICHHVEL